MRRGLLLATFLVSALVAGGVVLGLTGRSTLDTARRQVDDSWTALEAVLDPRYRALGEVGTVLREEAGRAEGVETPLVDEVEAGVARWVGLQGVPAGSAGPRVEAASALEGLVRRITVTVEASPRLAASPRLKAALQAAAAPEPGVVDGYNDAVRRYERLRGGLPRRLTARALGYDARPTFEQPA